MTSYARGPRPIRRGPIVENPELDPIWWKVAERLGDPQWERHYSRLIDEGFTGDLDVRIWQKLKLHGVPSRDSPRTVTVETTDLALWED